MPTWKYCPQFYKTRRVAAIAVSAALVLWCLPGGACGLQGAEKSSATPRDAGTELEPFKVAKPQPGQDAVYDATQAIARKPKAASGYIARGQAYRVRGEYAKALVDLDQAVALEPRNSEALVERSAARLANADQRGALEDAQAAIKLTPAGAEGYQARGAVRLESGEATAAIDDFTRAIALDEKRGLAYLLRARAKTELAPPAMRSALADVESALAIAPASADSFYGKGVVLLASNRQREAAESFAEAVGLNPRHQHALFEQAKFSHNRGDRAGAREDVERLLVNAEGMLRAEILLLRAEIWCTEKNPQAALVDCAEAQRLAPDFALVYIARATAKLAMDPRDFAGARADADEAVRRRPRDVRAYHIRANVQLQSNDNEGAIASWDQAIALRPEGADFYAGRAAAKAKLQRQDEAKADVSRALELAPNLPMALVLRRFLAMSADKSPPAAGTPGVAPGQATTPGAVTGEMLLAGLDELLAVQPQHIGALENRAKAKTTLRNPDWRGAVADATRVIDLDPRQAGAYAIRGRGRAGLNDLPGALRDLNRALELNPALSGEAYIDRAEVKAALRDYKGAVADFDRGLEIEVNSLRGPRFVAAAFSNRANARAKLGDSSGALRDYDEAVKRVPDFAEVYYNRGSERFNLKDFEGAKADFTRCIELKPEFPNAYINRGGVFFRQRNLDEALADYNRAIEVAPKLTEAYIARARIYRQQGREAEALEDLSRVIADNPTPAGFGQRGRVRAVTGDFSGALADFEQAMEERSDYTRFFHFLMARRLGKPQAAEVLRRVPGWAEGWSKTIGQYLLGLISEAEFLARAEKGQAGELKGQRCEAWYYIGAIQFLAGETTKAAESFKRSIETGERTFTEYELAAAELKRMGQP
jgi:tetratricopeptide (TPR) repeat protein